MTSISFTANHIKDSQVLRINQLGTEPLKTAFVEFQPTDLEAINEFNDDIGYAGGNRAFAKSSFKNNHIYGLTTQTDSFEKINSDNILGLVTATDKNEVITSMRIRPEARTPIKKNLLDKIFGFIFGSNYQANREYKYVGTALLDGLKSVGDDIAVFSPKKSVKFFVKSGFKNPFQGNKKYLKWTKM